MIKDNNLLFELMSEEIPAAFHHDATFQLKERATKLFTEAMLVYDSMYTFITPRRLVLMVYNIKQGEQSKHIEKKGPAISAGQAAVRGFAKKYRVSIDELVQQNNYYYYIAEQNKIPLKHVLSEILQTVIDNFVWPKSMKWGNNHSSWVRPIMNILCLLNEDVITIQHNKLTSNNITYGHFFMTGNKPLVIKSPREYLEILHQHYVIVDQNIRLQNIVFESNKVATLMGKHLIDHPKLFEEINGLIEFPVILTINIDKRFMSLPKELMTSFIEKHQKYIVLLNKDNNVSDKVIVVSNITCDNNEAIAKGHQRVLNARFMDAEFLWNADKKLSVQDYKQKLKDITLHSKLGTMSDKVERLDQLTHDIAPYILEANVVQLQEAVSLCKIDMPTNIVQEFPSLQGLLGTIILLTKIIMLP